MRRRVDAVRLAYVTLIQRNKAIRRDAAAGMSQRAIAEKYRISRSTVSRVCSNLGYPATLKFTQPHLKGNP